MHFNNRICDGHSTWLHVEFFTCKIYWPTLYTEKSEGKKPIYKYKNTAWHLNKSIIVWSAKHHAYVYIYNVAQKLCMEDTASQNSWETTFSYGYTVFLRVYYWYQRSSTKSPILVDEKNGGIFFPIFIFRG